MVDKNYCMSSFLTFRYIADPDMEFKEGLHHTGDMPYPEEKKVLVRTAEDIAKAYKQMFAEKQKDVKLGILLSGGMDSSCLAAFMKPGTDAYTFRFLDATYSTGDMERAKLYAEKYKLNLHYVDINWDIVKKNLPALMKMKGAPVHSIEPQIMEAALQAKKDGVEMMVAADGSDLVFGGMDKMLSKDWDFDEWVDFYTFVDPKKVLREPVSMLDVYERFRLPNNKIDFLRFQDEIFAHESSASYCNAFITAGMKYTPFFDPSGMVKMAEPLDLKRVRSGESKYLIRELFHMCYPEFPIPEKVPMPRPVDIYFKDWQGPTRPEFRRDIDMTSLTGNQKWLIYCLEEFLNMVDPIKIGYTTGVYDLFHIGHLNLLRKAKAQCDYLIVGVSTDDLVEYKGKRSVIPFEERKEIVGAIKYVDEVVTQENMDKLGAWKKYHFNVMFVGDDWKGTDKWNKIEADLKEVGADVVYFPYTKGTSSTLINETLIRLREANK